ncbi:mechanosensitive ion channel [Chitinophaga oryzae]|uniref:Mechanosensitive ion channel n=1 Tax=Chitinophaga oryzae TaxID=2725414 RepID=A0AAE6ZMG8_9BACT|nr:mechanosensitive ion channel domain-containing protein [Chitinophaga oryzae]QJB35474.1 mechanosensitive ion channel [Chitinophaga oryzae]QJB42017.1 mechanosensitive ion channel [Chitinophaga oryzae]
MGNAACAQSGKDTTAVTASGPAKLSVDSLLIRMEDLHNTLDRINDITSRGFDTRGMQEDLPEIKSNLQTIEDNLKLYNKVLNIRNLQMFHVLLADMREHLEDWRSRLFNYNKELVKMNAEMMAFTKDSFVKQIKADTTFRNFYLPELKELKSKWVEAKAATTQHLDKISLLQAGVSGSYFKALELENKVDKQLKVFSLKSLGKEYNYLWEDNGHRDAAADTLTQQSSRSLEGLGKILNYYAGNHSDIWWWMLLIGLVFFFRVNKQFKRIKKAGKSELLQPPYIKYLRALPFAGTLVIILNIASFFDLNAPAAYIDLLQSFLLIILTVLFWRRWERRMFIYWIAIVVLYMLTTGTAAVVVPDLRVRIWMLVLNVLSVITGLFIYFRIYRNLSAGKLVRIVSAVFVVFNVLAALFNLYGRLSIAQVYSTAAIAGLLQIIGLTVFVQIVEEAFYLQMQSSRIAGGITARFDFEKIREGLHKILTVLVVVLWLMVFTTNLNIYNDLYNGISSLISTPRIIGTTSFTLGNILLFFVILLISNLFQKYIGYFFGETDDDMVGEVKEKSSRLLLLRLLVLVAGFLIAIAASGLPMDKITVVLGALGVGIGLGLQNIVNNLVSGVILIFERPLKIGDYVEVAGQKGRVKDIGIRSSRMVTTEGAEVTVPNGDLLSSKLINWTLSNNHIRTELLFTIAPSSALPLAKEIILEEVSGSDAIIGKVAPELLVKSINDNNVALKLQVWIRNVHHEEAFKSRMLQQVYQRLKDNEITMS